MTVIVFILIFLKIKKEVRVSELSTFLQDDMNGSLNLSLNSK